jgi:hypothetical protein
MSYLGDIWEAGSTEDNSVRLRMSESGRRRDIQSYIQRKPGEERYAAKQEFKEIEGGRRNNEQGICPTCNRVRTSPHIEVQGTKIWRDEVSDKRFRNVGAGMSVRMRSGCSNKVQRQKLGIYATEYK